MVEVDVAIVGAGLSGLAAARQLTAAGLSVVVVEARDRVGGRTLNHRLDNGEVVELGGQWIGPGMDRVAALAAELGLETFPTYDTGRRLIEEHTGRVRRYRGTYPKSSVAALVDVGLAQRRLTRMARQISLSEPWASPRSRDWDSQTAWSWLQSAMHTRSGRNLMQLGIQATLAVDPADLSLLHLLTMVKTAGSLDFLTRTRGGAQQERIRGGSQALSKQLAAQLGDRVRLNSPVRSIEYGTAGAIVRADGLTVHARRLIVAMSPMLTARIQFDPPLPGHRDQLAQRIPQGTAIKCMAIYDHPWWRDQGLSGQAVSLAGPVGATFDNSPPDGEPGVLLGFVEASHARGFAHRPADQRRQEVLACFERLFGPQARKVQGYLESEWTEDPWTRGCYVGYFTPGGWTSHGRSLRQSIGPIHWAGAETATRWMGFMDGAITAGERAAYEVHRAVDAQVDPRTTRSHSVPSPEVPA